MVYHGRDVLTGVTERRRPFGRSAAEDGPLRIAEGDHTSVVHVDQLGAASVTGVLNVLSESDVQHHPSSCSLI